MIIESFVTTSQNNARFDAGVDAGRRAAQDGLPLEIPAEYKDDERFRSGFIVGWRNP